MNEELLEVAQENAYRNFEHIKNQLPSKLIKKEEALFEKMSKHRGNPLTKLRFLYEFMDEIYTLVNQFTPCNKGCNHCCKYSVLITDIEVAYIEATTKIKRLKTLLPHKNFHGCPCPFLKNGSCGIYQARPFVCRRHVTMCHTSIWCDPNRSNDHTFPLLNFSEVEKCYDLIIRESGIIEKSDIHQIFYSNIFVEAKTTHS